MITFTVVKIVMMKKNNGEIDDDNSNESNICKKVAGYNNLDCDCHNYDTLLTLNDIILL